MPQGRSSSGGSGDDFASTDELKVYKEEGEEETNKSLENLSEEKFGLLNEQEKSLENSSVSRSGFLSDPKIGLGNSWADYYPFHSRIPFGYPLINPYSYTPGFSNVPILPPNPWFYMYNNDHFSQGPQGLSSLHISSRGYQYHHAQAAAASSMYPHISTVPSSHLVYSTDLVPMSRFEQFSHNNHVPYPMTFGSPFLSSPMSSSSLARFNPGEYFSPPPPPPLPPSFSCPGISHPTLVSTYPAKDETCAAASTATAANAYSRSRGNQSVWFPIGRTSDSSKLTSTNEKLNSSHSLPEGRRMNSRRRMHIKKPLNAFMIFMKEMRTKVVDECTLKESAAINQILGRKWHLLDQAEQAKYYDMARKEKQLHKQMFPGWSARDNYATQLRKKRKREQMKRLNGKLLSIDDDRENANLKKCRARYGLEHQHRWCKPCRRKKRCVRFLGNDADDSGDALEDNSNNNNNNMPTADSTVNESHLYISMSPSMASSSIDADGLMSEPINSLRTQSFSSGYSNFQDFPLTFQFCPKSMNSSWSDSSSSTNSPSSRISANANQTIDSTKRISSTTFLKTS